MTLLRSLHLALGIIAAACTPACLQAQAVRLRAPVAHPNSLLPGSLIGVSATPSLVSFNLIASGIANGSAPVTITAIVTNPLLTTVNLYGYFSSGASALTGNTSHVSIPSNAVSGLVPTGVPTTWSPFTQTSPLSGSAAGLELASVGGLVVATSVSYTLSLRIDLSALPQLPADTYAGTLYIQAQIF